MIKNILFDMGGIVTLQNAEEAHRRFRSLGVDTEKYIGKYGHQGIFGELEAGQIDDNEFCTRLAKLIGKEHVSWQEAFHCWMGFKKCAPKNRLDDLLQLKGQYHVCLLSNTNPFVMSSAYSDEFCDYGKPITHFFHSVFTSYELGVCKPDTEIYKKALSIDSMKAEETIFVDDSIRNIQAAESLGIHGLFIPTNEEWHDPLHEMLQRLV